MDFKNAQELLQKWEELCESQHSAKNQNKTTVGAEIEFFLMSSDNRPVTLEQSQIFFHAIKHRLANLKAGVKSEIEELAGTPCISKVKFPSTSHSWTYICYEYPPHLLEISFAFHENLIDLSHEIQEVLATVHSVAQDCQLVAYFSPKLSKEEKNHMHRVDNKLQKVLRESRVKMLQDGSYANEIDLADFPSYLAATHIHIGGHKWWKDKSFVNNLYRLEPYLMHEAVGIDFKERWDHYYKVFQRFALVGFPQMPFWTTEGWIGELFASSYQTQKAKITCDLDFNKLRDLQIIRPRAIGTIEFRSDSAQSGADQIMHLAALRLGQYLLCQAELPDWVPNYELSRKIWFNQMETGEDLEAARKESVLQLIHSVLKKRNLGEEKLLRFELKKLDKTA